MKKTFFLIFIIVQSLLFIISGLYNVYYLSVLVTAKSPGLYTVASVYSIISIASGILAVVTMTALFADWKKKNSLDRALLYAIIAWCVSTITVVINYFPLALGR